MEKVQLYEINSFLNVLKYVNKHEWMQTRWLMYSFLLPYFKKGHKNDIEKFFPLPFDEKYKPLKKTISNEENIKMQQLAEEFISITKKKAKTKAKTKK